MIKEQVGTVSGLSPPKMARQTPRSVVAGRVVLPPLQGSATLACIAHKS
jgi:hypothetical protein